MTAQGAPCQEGNAAVLFSPIAPPGESIHAKSAANAPPESALPDNANESASEIPAPAPPVSTQPDVAKGAGVATEAEAVEKLTPKIDIPVAETHLPAEDTPPLPPVPQNLQLQEP
jgi:hypothetical protein